nr:hypothetical protein [Rhodoferax sp.]
MKLNPIQWVSVTAGMIFALFMLLGEPTTQDTATHIGAQTKQRATDTFNSQPKPPWLAPEYLQPCDTLSPFARNSTPCNPSPISSPSDSAQAGSSSEMSPMPEFVNVQVVGTLGGGVVGSFLKSAGRSLSGTPQNHDSMLIDVSEAKDTDVAASIQEALDSGKYLIVDGSDSIEGSTRVNQIMLDRKLISIQGVTAYGVIKGADDKVYVTPLQSVADKSGVRAVDQMHNVLGIKKS